MWDELEETLLIADVGAAATEDILEAMRSRLKREPDVDAQLALRDALLALVDPSMDRSLDLAPRGTLTPIVVVGVNGVGKTTTVGKLARVLVADGRAVVLGAADTFRAAAADQLETWGARVGVTVVRSHLEGADPASVAYDATERAVADGADVVLIDTAGRLQNKQGLMDELGKIVRVASKVAPPRETLLVLDATTGQNGLNQARVFAEAVGLTGIVLTKLDGTAKGGIVIAVQRELGVPVKYVGLGEGADDLAPFDAESFVSGIMGN
jgi:fused signal recognition particle receptor